MVPQKPPHLQQPPPQQLDIFAHSRDVMLRNDVLHALDRRYASGARAAWLVLAGEFPTAPDLAPLDLLACTLAAPCDAPLPDHDALAREQHRLTHDVAVAARRGRRRTLAAPGVARARRALRRSAVLGRAPERPRRRRVAARRPLGECGAGGARYRVVAAHSGAIGRDGRGPLPA